MEQSDVILGAGVTGLSACWASGMRLFEAETRVGGICRSYYVKPGSNRILDELPPDGSAYRFETGGGHWIFGGDPIVLRFISRFCRLHRHQRRAVIYFPDLGIEVPYPLQYNLSHLGREIADQAISEMKASPPLTATTLDAWLEQTFGRTLTDLFFGPFHEAYTAGLWRTIAPQDGFKSPVNIAEAVRGTGGSPRGVGYNATFLYPEEGLAHLADSLAASADLHYGRAAAAVDLRRREIQFSSGAGVKFDTLISTLPLNRMLTLCGLTVDEETAPFTSVLVLNIGAERGPACPDAHWVYVPKTRSGFHRVGFYSNVSSRFLPAKAENRVSLYVERAFVGGKPSQDAIDEYSRAAIAELKGWGFIGEVEVLDHSWVEVAYTWSRPGSRWREQALTTLAEHDIVMAGRYATWRFQGIADSIRDGLLCGAALRGRGVSAGDGG